jgi:hypothetical protein
MKKMTALLAEDLTQIANSMRRTHRKRVPEMDGGKQTN